MRKLTEIILQNNTLTSSSGIGIIFFFFNHIDERTKTPETITQILSIARNFVKNV